MPLIIYSNSTEKFAKSMSGAFLKVNGLPTKELFKMKTDRDIIAIGGGSVIDTAKIIAKNSDNVSIIAIPTTASGASETSHAVYWDKHRKYSVKTPRPVSRIAPSLFRTLPIEVIKATSYDALGHSLESYWSKNATDISKRFAKKSFEIVAEEIRNGYLHLDKLIEGGIFGGKAIEITGTNVVHAISYPLTGIYGIPHGVAVGLVLPAVARFIGCEFKIPEYKITIKKDFDVNLISDEAMNYSQIHDAVEDFDKGRVIKILEESL